MILAVDDVQDNLFVLEQLIADGLPDCAVVTATSAREGLSLAASAHFSIALIDVQMPEIDGIEMCRQLKADPATQDIHVILLTAHEAGSKLRTAGLDAGAVDFVSKPIDNAELIARINASLRVRRAEDALRQINARLDDLVGERTRELNEELVKREQAVAALESSEQRLRAVFDSAGDYILLLDLDYEVQLLNRGGLGWEMSDIVGRPLHELAGDRQRVLDYLDRVVRDGEPCRWECAFPRRDGSGTMHLSSIASPIIASGKTTGVVVCVRDVTEQVHLAQEKAQLEEKYQQAQRMESIGQLAGGVAHDFNNLLTVINNYAEFAVDDLRDEDPLKHDLQQVLGAGQRAATLVRQLLAFSRKQHLAPQVLDLNEVVVDLEKMLVRLIGEHIEFSTELADDLGLVNADTGQLEQVLMNLVVNARDAMPEGGKLTIKTANVELDEDFTSKHPETIAGSYVRLAVTDDGVGITDEIQARVFEPFFTTKDKGQGTGLGLATAYGIVKQSQGNIWVHSEPGRGTTFEVYLPRVEARKTEQPLEATSPDLRGSETVLVVEDEDVVRKLTCRILSSAGYEVIAAANGGEALLEFERRDDVRLLLTDVVMPKMGGVDLAERLSKIQRELKVLYMSGYSRSTATGENLLEAGAHLITKPFHVPELLRKVRMVLDSE